MGFFGNKSSTLRPTALLMQYIKNVSDTLSYLLQFDIFFRCKQVVLRKYRLLLHLLKWSTYGQPYWQSRKASGAFSGLEQPSFCNLLEANIERNFWQDSLLRIFGYIANKKKSLHFSDFQKPWKLPKLESWLLSNKNFSHKSQHEIENLARQMELSEEGFILFFRLKSSSIASIWRLTISPMVAIEPPRTIPRPTLQSGKKVAIRIRRPHKGLLTKAGYMKRKKKLSTFFWSSDCPREVTRVLKHRVSHVNFWYNCKD